MTGLVYWLDMAGVIVFALSGVILACRSRMNPFGVVVLAGVTGIGGGTLRDLVLGVRPVYWVTDPSYLWVVLLTALSSILVFHHVQRLSRGFLPVADAFGLALFTVIGAHKALMLGTPGVVAVLMGLLTGVAGGMIRDVLARRVPMVLGCEVYATASIAGGMALVGLEALSAPLEISITTGLLITLGLRLSAIYWRLSEPVFAWMAAQPPQAPEVHDDGGQHEDGRDEAAAVPQRKAKALVRMITSGRARQRGSSK